MTQSNPKDNRVSFPAAEEEVLAFWEKEAIFQKTLEKTKDGTPFVFFEGPPTANGRPGIHHVIGRAFKDVIPRYKTMQGFYVERKAGWDTHGLPVELQVEKELGISGKPEIEKYGIAEFNQKSKESVWQYKEEWEQLTKRIGFWLDLEHPYITYQDDYIETLWWTIKQIWDKGLLYQGYKVVPHCPRCGTALSSHEVAQGYEEVTDDSVYVKFRVKDEEDTYILSWTTTPWTLPGNVALAVGEKIQYVKAKIGDEQYIMAQSVLERLGEKAKVVEEMTGADLVGTAYEPLFDISDLQSDTSHQVYAADFVNTDEGTGVVHTAVMYGEDDYQLGEKIGLPKHHTVDENGNFTDDVPQWAGKFVKDKEVERGIITHLQEQGLLFKEEPYKHSYPFCWRCDTPLLYYAKDSWFIKMTELKQQLINNNEKINWVPGHFKHGRFGEWLNELKDWAFSRERYWGTPLPLWKSDDGDYICVGSFEELKQFATDPKKVDKWFDPHRPHVDEIILEKDGKKYMRVPEVVDVWFDSGAMPFAQWHYPFENKEHIDSGAGYPAAYISEAVDQTRGWFYTLLAVATLLGKEVPYQNVICYGHVLDSKGQKMSKSRGNIVLPMEMINKYGVDALRWFFFTVNQPGEAKLFDEKKVEEIVKKNWLILMNVVNFWKMYSKGVKGDVTDVPQSKYILDQWILARLHTLIDLITNKLDNYEITEAARAVTVFIAELSQWYVRRSRGRFKKADPEKDAAVATLHYVLVTLAKVMAPFVPFVAESVYQKVTGDTETSVHLADWPTIPTSGIDTKILDSMNTVRTTVELGHAVRKEQQLKVRQPLSQFIIQHKELDKEYTELIKDEMNVETVAYVAELPSGTEFARKESGAFHVALDTTITDELRHQGIAREMIRHINALRKDGGLTIDDTITIYYEISDDELEGIFKHYKDSICPEVIASQCLAGIPDNVDLKKVLELSGKKVLFGIKKQ